MTYDTQLAGKVKMYLSGFAELEIDEKKMFRGLAFIINGKMCINVSGDNLMCRFNPHLTDEIGGQKGFLPMVMKGKEYKGYCYVQPAGFKSKKDFAFGVNLSLDYNSSAVQAGKTGPRPKL